MERTAQTTTPGPGMAKMPALDGWRAISIPLVLAGHLLPLGHKRLDGNATIAALGMAIFFTLSGFLITSTLLHRPSVMEFLIRRLCWILPLAWLFTLVIMLAARAPAQNFIAQLLFFSNIPPFWLTEYTGHLWSLCVEMQFYMAIAMVVTIFGRPGLWFVPLLCLIVTAYRIETQTLISIVTTLRVDEILTGGVIALAIGTDDLGCIRKFLTWANPYVLLPAALASASPFAGQLG